MIPSLILTPLFSILEQPHTFPTFVRAPFISVKLGFSNYQVWFPHSYFDWQQTLPENRKDYLLKRGNCTIQCTPMFIFKHFLLKLLFIWRKCTNMQSICIPHYTASLREGILKICCSSLSFPGKDLINQVCSWKILSPTKI